MCFKGGGGSNAASSGGAGNVSPLPPKKPEYLVKGTGRDAVYTNTRTGETAAAPDYSPFSFKGLTSNDPGNRMRNQEAVQRYNAMPQQEQRGGKAEEMGGGAPPPVPLGPKVCPVGFKLFTFPDGSTTCVPVPPDPQALSPAPMLRPVIAPYHKAAGIESLANYVPYIPGRT